MHFFVPPWLRHGRARAPASVFSVDVEPHGSRLASGGQDCAVKIWSLSILSDLAVPVSSAPPPNISDTPPPNALLATLSSHSSAVNCVRWAPQGVLLASAGDDAVVLIYELVDGESGGGKGFGGKMLENWRVKRLLRGHAGDVTDVCWSPDGQKLASASVDNVIYVWSLRNERATVRLDGHTGLVKGVAWDPVGRYLASQSDDRSLRIWRTADWKTEKVIVKPFDEAVVKENSMAFFLRISWSPCGGHLLATNAYKKPGAHHAPMFSREKGFDGQIEFVGHREPVVSTRFSPRLYRAHPGGVEVGMGNGARKEGDKEADKGDDAYTCLALGSKDCGATIWRAGAARPFCDMAQMFGADVIDLSWGTDGYTLVSCSTDGQVMYIRFEPQELGNVVGLEETREILTNRWRRFGGAGDNAVPIVESAAQLNLEIETAEEEKRKAEEELRKAELERLRLIAIEKEKEEEERREKEKAQQTEQALAAKEAQRDNQVYSSPSSPMDEVPITPPVDAEPQQNQEEQVDEMQEGGNEQPSQLQQSKPQQNDQMDIAEDPEVDRADIVEETLDSQAANRAAGKPPEPSSGSEKRSSIPDQLVAAAAAARENGPTPPADPRIMAAQNEVRVKGKRRITPMSVTAAAGAARPPLPTPLSNSRLGAFDGAPNGVAAEWESPFKRPRVNPFSREVSRDGGQLGNPPPNGNHMPNGSAALLQRVNNMVPNVAQHVQHAANLYAPSVIGLSMMLLPDRGDGPGRSRVISDGTPEVVLESREQHGNGGGYVVTVSSGGKVQWRDYHTKSSPITALAGIVGKYVAVGTGDGMLFLYSASSGRRLVPPIAIDSAPHMLEAFSMSSEDPADISDVNGEREKWFVILVSRSALCTVFDVKAKKLICARSAAPLLAKPAEAHGTADAAVARAKITREISFCKVTESGEPILILSDGHAFVYSTDFCSWLRVADDSAPSSDFVRTVPSAKKFGLLRALQPGSGLTQKSLPTLSGMADLQRAAVESLSHLESLMESAIVLGSPIDYRYYLTNYATRIAAAVSDDVENCEVRLRELCDSFLNSSQPSKDLAVLGMSSRSLLRDTILPIIAANRQMQRFVTEYTEGLAEIEILCKQDEQSS